MNIPSILRHWFTVAATTATLWWIATLTLSEEDAKTLTAAMGALVEPLVVIGALLITAGWRLALAYVAKIFRTGSGEQGEQKNGSGGLGSLPLFLMGTMAGLMGCLPSCSGSYPLTGSVSYQDAATGAKGGLTFSPGEAPRARVALPITDAKGRVVGHVDLTSAK